MSKLDKDTVIEKFTKAYESANGKAPSIEASGGWYSVDGGKNIRLAQLDEMADELSSGGKPDQAAAEKTSPAAEKKPAKAPAKKVAAKQAKKPASSFSVKDFYTQQILEANPGSKAPR